MYQGNRRHITFKEPWGARSWLVDYDGPYANTRPPHVEVIGYTPTPGSVHALTNLHVINKKAMAWDVEGVTNHGMPAHFTVYYGGDALAEMERFK